MSQSTGICQHCNERPGYPWHGSGPHTCLCGRCKVRLVLGGDNGRKLGLKLGSELGVTVEINLDDTTVN